MKDRPLPLTAGVLDLMKKGYQPLLSSEAQNRLWEKYARLSEVDYPRYDLMLEYWDED